jgi:hypothetical protein
MLFPDAHRLTDRTVDLADISFHKRSFTIIHYSIGKEKVNCVFHPNLGEAAHNLLG